MQETTAEIQGKTHAHTHLYTCRHHNAPRHEMTPSPSIPRPFRYPNGRTRQSKLGFECWKAGNPDIYIFFFSFREQPSGSASPLRTQTYLLYVDTDTPSRRYVRTQVPTYVPVHNIGLLVGTCTPKLATCIQIVVFIYLFIYLLLQQKRENQQAVVASTIGAARAPEDTPSGLCKDHHPSTPPLSRAHPGGNSSWIESLPRAHRSSRANGPDTHLPT